MMTKRIVELATQYGRIRVMASSVTMSGQSRVNRIAVRMGLIFAILLLLLAPATNEVSAHAMGDIETDSDMMDVASIVLNTDGVPAETSITDTGTDHTTRRTPTTGLGHERQLSLAVTGSDWEVNTIPENARLPTTRVTPVTVPSYTSLYASLPDATGVSINTVAGNITTDTTWDMAGSPYVVSSDIAVASGVTLTIDPGVTVQLSSNRQLAIYGTLNALGTPGNEVIFTNISGLSFGLLFYPGSTGNLAYSIIEGANYGIHLTSPASFNMDHSVLQNNSYGIYSSGGQITVRRSDITGNTSYGIYSSGSTVINAENNWWGDASGPLDSSDDRATGGLYNPSGLGDEVSDSVDYSPWVTDHDAWSVPMTAVTATEGSNENLELGVRAGATDGYDSGIDVPHPPPGPGIGLDAYFSITDLLFPQLDEDYRAPADSIQWTLHVESSSEDITLTWDTSSVPADVSLYMDTGIGVINMKAQNTVVLPAGVYNITITVSPEVEIQIALEAGWNMVSIPVVPQDTSVASVFAGAEVVYTWDPTTKTYYVPTNVQPDKGYWVAVLSDSVLSVTGVPVYTWTADIIAGWNMIGSVFGSVVDFTDPQDNPDGSVESFVYWWNPVTKSYEFGTIIEPTKGYWAAATQDCSLTLSIP